MPHPVLTAIDDVLADRSLSSYDRKLWITARTAAAKAAGERDRRGGQQQHDPEEIRRLLADGLTHQEVARKMGCGLATVNRAKRG